MHNSATRCFAPREPFQHDEFEEATHISIAKLSTLNVNVADIAKLQDNGYHTVGLALLATTRELGDIKGFSEAKVNTVLAACRKLTTEFASAKGLHAKKTAEIQFITSGSKAVDELLGGGFETSSLTEIFGEARWYVLDGVHCCAGSCMENLTAALVPAARPSWHSFSQWRRSCRRKGLVASSPPLITTSHRASPSNRSPPAASPILLCPHWARAPATLLSRASTGHDRTAGMGLLLLSVTGAVYIHNLNWCS